MKLDEQIKQKRKELASLIAKRREQLGLRKSSEPRKKLVRLTVMEKTCLVRDYEKGYKYKHLSSIYNVSYSTILNVLREFGVIRCRHDDIEPR